LPSLKHGCPPGRAEVKEILRANKTRHTMAATDVRGRSFCTSVYMECIPLYSYIVYKLYNDIRLYIYTELYIYIYIIYVCMSILWLSLWGTRESKNKTWTTSSSWFFGSSGAEVHFMENVFGDFEFPNFDEAWLSQWHEASELESHGHGQFVDLPSYKMGGFSAMWNHLGG
jgi:hypothetical protein